MVNNIKTGYEKVLFPYGDGKIEVKIPCRNLSEILTIDEPDGLSDEKKEISKAIETPLKTFSLRGLVNPNSRIALIVSDITRPVPNDKLVPCILGELSSASADFDKLTMVIATGMHRKNSIEEMESMLGSEIVNRLRIINHDAFESSNLIGFGETSRGTTLKINKIVAKADVKIATSYIEPHEFAGFTGGRKSILPGVSGIDTIKMNHRPEMLDHPKSKIGILDGNPIHEDMVEATKIIGLDFIVNVVLNSRREITKVVAGDFIGAHLEGVEFYRKFSAHSVQAPAEIVIASSGYPLDSDLYQSIKSVIAAEPFAKEGGFIILLTESRGGFGPGAFGEWMRNISSVDEVYSRIKKERFSPELDHCYLLAKILRKVKVIIVSQNPKFKSINFGKELYKTDRIDEALGIAFSEMGKKADVLCLPYAPRMIIR